MEAQTVRNVIANLRNPINAKLRVHFTSRSVLFLVKLFEGKRIDTIDLHCILLRAAYVSGCFHDVKKVKYINMKDLVVYICSQIPACITIHQVRDVANTFNVENDSDYHEVEDMKTIISSITQES